LQEYVSAFTPDSRFRKKKERSKSQLQRELLKKERYKHANAISSIALTKGLFSKKTKRDKQIEKLLREDTQTETEDFKTKFNFKLNQKMAQLSSGQKLRNKTVAERKHSTKPYVDQKLYQSNKLK